MFSWVFGKFVAPFIARRGLGHLGSNPRFAGWITLRGGKNVFIGNDFFAGSNLYISTSRYSQVSIGDAVMFGPFVYIFGGDHKISHNLGHMRYNQVDDESSKDIVVETGAWIGSNSIILSGANIGEGAVIGAASVVNKSVPPYCVAVGNKLRVVGCRFKTVSELKIAIENCNSAYSVENLLKIYASEGVELGG